MFESLKRKFDKLFTGERRKSDAFLVLNVFWGKRIEDAIRRREQRKQKKRQKT